MSQKALIIPDAAFNGLNTASQNWCKNNIAGYNATRWAERLIHPVDGRIAFVVEDRMKNSLSANDISNIIELPVDWFPVIKPF